MTPIVWTLNAVILYLGLAATVVHICESGHSPRLARATVSYKLLLTVFAPITIVVMLVIVFIIDPHTNHHTATP